MPVWAGIWAKNFFNIEISSAKAVMPIIGGFVIEELVAYCACSGFDGILLDFLDAKDFDGPF